MYNTKYICVYNTDDIFSEEEQHKLTRKEKDFILNCLYRNDLLYIFDLDELEPYADRIINELYDKIKNEEFLLSCMKQLAGDYFNTNDEKVGLIILYSFEMLYLTHPYICEFLETGKISEKTKKELEKKVFKSQNQ